MSGNDTTLGVLIRGVEGVVDDVKSRDGNGIKFEFCADWEEVSNVIIKTLRAVNSVPYESVS